MKSININLKTTKLLNEYYQEQALDTIINDKEGTFTVELDADHEGIKSGVYFPIGFEHMVNYYSYLKGGSNLKFNICHVITYLRFCLPLLDSHLATHGQLIPDISDNEHNQIDKFPV